MQKGGAAMYCVASANTNIFESRLGCVNTEEALSDGFGSNEEPPMHLHVRTKRQSAIGVEAVAVRRTGDMSVRSVVCSDICVGNPE
jgi:hypothetical protein